MSRTHVASGAGALVIALAVTFFVLGRGPGTLVGMTGKPPVWLPFAGSGLNWVPMVHRVEWEPFKAAASVASAGRTASPSPGSSHSPSQSPAPAAGERTPTPHPSATATPRPGATPTPTPRATPAPSPSASASPAVLYANGFDADPLSSVPHGMTVQSGSWQVVADPGHVLAGRSTGTILTTSGSSWTDYRVSTRVKAPAGTAGVVARGDYSCVLTSGATLSLGRSGAVQKTGTFSYTPGNWYSLTLTARGNGLTCSVYDAASGRSQSISLSVASITSGPAGLTTTGGAEFDNLEVVAVSG